MNNIDKTNSPICRFLNKLEKLSIYHINRFLFVQLLKTLAKGYKHKLLNNIVLKWNSIHT